MNTSGISQATQEACMQTFDRLPQRRTELLQQLGDQLPPFRELMRVVEKRSLGREPMESESSYTYSSFEARRDSRRMSDSLSDTSQRSPPTNNLKTLADIMASRNFSELESTQEREQSAYSFLVHFLSTTKSLNSCFSELYHQLQLKEFSARLKMSETNIEQFLLGKDSNNEEHGISREDFKKWVVQVPTIMYENISEALAKFSALLDELKSMKEYYELEDKVKEVEAQLVSDSKVENTIPRNIYKDDLKFQKRYRLYKTNAPKKVTNYIKTEQDNIHKSLKKRKGRARKSEAKSDSCSHCGTMATPEWRKGPTGSRTLCNACGLFYSKLTKRFGSEGAVIVFDSRKNSNLTSDRTVPTHGEYERIKSPLD